MIKLSKQIDYGDLFDEYMPAGRETQPAMSPEDVDRMVADLLKDLDIFGMDNLRDVSEPDESPRMDTPPDAGFGKYIPELNETLDEEDYDINTIARDKVDLHPESVRKKPRQKTKRSVSGAVSSLLFYFVIAGALLLAYAASGRTSDGPRDIFGYSYFTVLSGSMQKELPVGSLLITRKTDPDKLQIGDNITFMQNVNTVITHKIIGIYENHDGYGARGFQTQGVNNPQPDRELVDAANVVGKVVFSLPGAGLVLSNLNDNIILFTIIFGLLLLLSFAFQIFFRLRKEERSGNEPGVKALIHP